MSLDIGEKRIGIAIADDDIKIAVPYDTIETANGKEFDEIHRLIDQHDVAVLVVGYPRNQDGEPTKQTRYVEDFMQQLGEVAPEVIYRDESLTSVLAEEQLNKTRRSYTKADIDMTAASIILADYIEEEER